MVNEKQLKETVKEILSRNDVKYVIGYEKGSYGFRTAPSFAYTSEDADKFIFSPLCVNNLAVYPMLEEKLPVPKGEKEDTRKIGIVVKGCDSRAVVQIIQEKGIRREDIVIIGIPCRGVTDVDKITARFPGQTETVEIKEEDDKFIIKMNGKTHKVRKEEVLLDKCKNCENPNPIIYDVLIGEEIKDIKKENYKKIGDFEKKSLEDKWRYWEKQFEKCIRCYACRNVCPMCYCKECVADQLDPQWIRRSVNVSENTVWNIIRAYHLAGRCVGCEECERACPMEIPLMELNKKLEKDVKEMFDYKSGMDAEGDPLLAMFKPDDPEEFIM